MKIESRVEVLENELKILKNEIQATLLEIREQVLNHYYPELRAEEPARLPLPPAKSSESRETRINETRLSEIRTNEVRAVEARPIKMAQPKAGNQPRSQATLSSHADQPMADNTKGQVQPFSDMFVQDMDGLNPDDIELDDVEIPVAQWEEANEDAVYNDLDEEEDMPARNASPQMREVGLQQLKQAGVAPKPRVKPSPAIAEPPSHKPNRRSFAALAAWVGNAVAKVGKERATQVVETYAASGGPLPIETKGSLMQLIGLASDVELADVVGNQEILSLMVELDQLLAD